MLANSPSARSMISSPCTTAKPGSSRGGQYAMLRSFPGMNRLKALSQWASLCGRSKRHRASGGKIPERTAASRQLIALDMLQHLPQAAATWRSRSTITPS